MQKGKIIGLNGGNYKVLTTDNEIVICRARGKLRNIKVDKNSSFNASTNKHSNKLETKYIKLSPKVGDEIICDLLEGVNYITEVMPRHNELIRPDIANVDQILLIFAATNPAFSFLLLDLFLINLAIKDIKPVIIITKIDMLESSELKELKEKLSYYENLGIVVVFVNSKAKENIELIPPLLEGKVSVLAGQTGAGKSTLINALIPGFTLETQEISKALGRGKHTTRETSLYQYFGGLIGDTPGFSKLDISTIKPNELSQYFVEFSDYFCQFKCCTHTAGAKNCGVMKAYENKEILSSRYENYLHIYNELKNSR